MIKIFAALPFNTVTRCSAPWVLPQSGRPGRSHAERGNEGKLRLTGHKRGSILLMVLVAIIMMTLTTSSYMLLMRGEHLAARYRGNHLQTKAMAQSGLEYLRVLLAQTPAELEQQGGLLTNPDKFQDLLVSDDQLANYRGRFTIVAPAMSQGYYSDLRYGLENESAKLNLNSLLVRETDSTPELLPSDESFTPRDRLLRIPGMNEAVADAILDWLDEDDSPRVNGAESSYYLSLASPYQPTNGPLRQLDELLMIQGVTPELLYGVDANRNYQVDTDELPRGALEQLDNTRGEINRGWSAYLTVHSLEKSVLPDGEPKINLNSTLLETLHNELQTAVGVEAANFIIAYRQYGAAAGDASDSNTDNQQTSTNNWQPDFEKAATSEISSPLDLIEATVQIEADEEKDKPAQTLQSPWSNDPGTYRQAFAQLLDNTTVDPSERIAGRININQASRPVLLTIPEMTEVIADQIVTRRQLQIDRLTSDQRHPTWLVADELVPFEQFKRMLPYLTTGGDVYRGQIVGYFEAGTARARAEVLLDRSDTETRLLDWHDLSQLGPGFPRSVLSRVAVLEE